MMKHAMKTDETERIGILGLGYVGLPLARLMSEKYPVVGFDTDQERVKSLQNGLDETGEVSPEALQEMTQRGVHLTANIADLRPCTIYIVCVPTPVDVYNKADLRPLRQASRLVGSILQRGDLVIYESTVYPGVTEDECVPCLTETSNLIYNTDFTVGYSPERINPGDTIHTVAHIKKVTAGSTPAAALRVDALYNSVIQAGTHPVSTIRVAEASKIIENTQRDVNIAFVNELAKIFNAMGLDTGEIIAAAATKWNFIPMTPGLVGGHCIGIDPYYLIQNAQIHGIMPRVISEARRLNDSMGNYVATQVITLMNRKNIRLKGAHILLLGFAFKENCPDIRNTKVADIYHTLAQYTPHITIHDPHVHPHRVQEEYHITITPNLSPQPYDAIIIAVAHDHFRTLDYTTLRAPRSILYDVKGLLPKDQTDGRL